MLLTLLGSGLKIDWNPETGVGVPIQLRGRARFIAAQKKANRLSGLRPAASLTLNSAESDSPEDDNKGSKEANRAIQRGIILKVMTRWHHEQSRRPGPLGLEEYARLDAEIKAACAAAGVDDL
jgi:hypothetical protein